MTIAQTPEPTPRRALRVWAGVVIVILEGLGRFVVPLVERDFMVFGVLGGVVGGLAVVLWWLFFSRAPWSERLGAVALMIVGLFATSRVVDKSIATGAMGMLFPVLASPVLSLAFVAWAVATRRLSDGRRRAPMVATILLACGVWTLVRTGGFTANFDNDLAWRWAKTPEERLLAQTGAEPAAPAAPAAVTTPQTEPRAPGGDRSAPAAAGAPKERLTERISATPTAVPPPPAATKIGADWPGFRGPDRNGVATGVRIKTDWSASPPVELWRRPIGPGWSSFAVRGDLLYTQEQRGHDEVVACYRASTGEPVWKHRDPARFWESNAGAGPRATPTLSNGRVYTLGATGILNALDAGSGAVVWSRNAPSDAAPNVPMSRLPGSPPL